MIRPRRYRFFFARGYSRLKTLHRNDCSWPPRRQVLLRYSACLPDSGETWGLNVIRHRLLYTATRLASANEVELEIIPSGKDTALRAG